MKVTSTAIIAAFLVVSGAGLLMVGSIEDVYAWLGVIPLALGIFLYGRVTVEDYKYRERGRK